MPDDAAEEAYQVGGDAVRQPAVPEGQLLLDCQTCVGRGVACGDCVVTVLLGPPAAATLNSEERRAVDVLSTAGLVPPLRLVRPVTGPDVHHP